MLDSLPSIKSVNDTLREVDLNIESQLRSCRGLLVFCSD